MPNVHLVHHSTLNIDNLHDHIHLRKDSVNVFAKNLKDVALGRTPGSPLKNNKESSNPQQKTRFLQTSPHGVFSPNPDERYFPVPWRLHQQQPMSQNFHPVPLYPHPEQQQPSFRPSHPHHPVPHHRQQHQDLVPPHQPRKKEPLLRKAPRMEQMSAPQPNPHKSERPEQLNYASALKGQKDTESTNLREFKDMLNLICTRLMDKQSGTWPTGMIREWGSIWNFRSTVERPGGTQYPLAGAPRFPVLLAATVASGGGRTRGRRLGVPSTQNYLRSPRVRQSGPAGAASIQSGVQSAVQCYVQPGAARI
ncbi:hypothetical protein IRJ41_007499 [Triplophysa rosa]|uniref:Uncharacterized protein n=1 Tax=Triplophysa rosa TaxID=992332 RepID=A0A9W7TPZ8_TRIRA|nr:hypothetical protein IRJ41_007499 [Triplophysa rosa]